MTKTTAPVAALTALGVLIAVLGLFTDANVAIVLVGLGAIVIAGVLQLLQSR